MFPSLSLILNLYFNCPSPSASADNITSVPASCGDNTSVLNEVILSSV